MKYSILNVFWSLVSDNVSDKYLNSQFTQFGLVTHVEIDRTRGQALVFFQQVSTIFQAKYSWLEGFFLHVSCVFPNLPLKSYQLKESNRIDQSPSEYPRR